MQPFVGNRIWQDETYNADLQNLQKELLAPSNAWQSIARGVGPLYIHTCAVAIVLDTAELAAVVSYAGHSWANFEVISHIIKLILPGGVLVYR